MGYTHSYYVAKEFDAGLFVKVATDFKKMITPLKHLGVVLADGLGENHPLISPTEIRFNGLEKCGHPKRGLGITWPSSKASGISKNNTDTQLEEITKSDWFAGAKLQTRACGGDCSHETFALEQKLKTTMTGYDDSAYELEPQGEYSVVTHQDGTRDKNPANEVGKYSQCTKTAYKPYDLAVTVCLVIAKHYLGEQILIQSDGTMENWHEAMQLCHHFLGYGRGFKLDDGESTPLDPASAEAMISECCKNQVEIKAIQTEQEKFRDQKEQEIAEIKDRYDNTINDLESQKYRETEKIVNKIDDAQKEADQKTDELAKAKTALDRTIYFLKMQEEQLDCKPLDEITNHGDRHLETIETYKDDCMELRLYVAENDRPKNKYSIIVAGKSKLGSNDRDDEILKLPHNYGVHIDAWGIDILSEIRHFSAIEDAKKYHKTHSLKKILKEFFGRYEDVHEEYKQACKKYKIEEFAEILHERFVQYWKNTSPRNREQVTKELNIGTTELNEMSSKQVQLLMKEELFCY